MCFDGLKSVKARRAKLDIPLFSLGTKGVYNVLKENPNRIEGQVGGEQK